jgi:intracellular sulfur oxidation DsrE/DsrF family protein
MSVTTVFNHLDKNRPVSLLIQYLVILINPQKQTAKTVKTLSNIGIKATVCHITGASQSLVNMVINNIQDS